MVRDVGWPVAGSRTRAPWFSVSFVFDFEGLW
jgi:hypothetical protein